MSGTEGAWWDEVATPAGPVVLRVRAGAGGVRLVVEGADARIDVLLPRDPAAALGAALGVAAGTMEQPGSPVAEAAPSPEGGSPDGPGPGEGGEPPPPGPRASRPWSGPRPGLPESLALRRQAIEEIRSVCAGLPETAEIEAMGSPTFRVATRTFAVVESDDGLPVVRVKLSASHQAHLLEDDRYRADVETGLHGWTSLRLDLAGTEALSDLVLSGYRTVAPAHLADRVEDPANRSLFDREG